MFAVVTCNSSMASCTLCQYPLVYDVINNTNPHKFVKKVTYSRSAQYFNFLKSTKFYIYIKKKESNHFLKKSKSKSICISLCKNLCLFQNKNLFFLFYILTFQNTIHQIIYFILYSLKYQFFFCFFNCFSFVTHNNHRLFSFFILVNN